jgi:hypothetical protein
VNSSIQIVDIGMHARMHTKYPAWPIRGHRTTPLIILLSPILSWRNYNSSKDWLWGLRSTSERVTLRPFPISHSHPHTLIHSPSLSSILGIARHTPLITHTPLEPNSQDTPPPFGQRITLHPFKRRNRASLQLNPVQPKPLYSTLCSSITTPTLYFILLSAYLLHLYTTN